MNEGEIRAYFKEHADVAYQEFEQKLIPGIRIQGVRLPDMRRLAKRICREDGGKKFLKHPMQACFEEKMLWGMVIGEADLSFEERCKALLQFAPQIDNWSVCDSAAASMHFIRQEKARFLPFLRSLSFSVSYPPTRAHSVCRPGSLVSVPSGRPRRNSLAVLLPGPYDISGRETDEHLN